MSDKKAAIYSQISIKMRRPSDVDIDYRTHLGRDYIVVPATILTEGVYVDAGSKKAIFYPRGALPTNIDAWNSRPVTIGHASGEAGGLVDPDTPEILERFQIGLLFHAGMKEEGKAIGVDVWLSSERLSTIAQKTREMIFNGEEIEVSVDAKIDAIIKKGTFQGEKFEAEAVFFHPKGLAVLENEEGACSFMDGCGIRNRACKKDNGCNDCKTILAEDKKMAEDDNKNKSGQDGCKDEAKDEGIIRSFVVAMTSLIHQKGGGDDAGDCGCKGDGKGKGKGEDKIEPLAPKTMDEALALVPGEFRTTLSAALASAETAKTAKDEKLKALRVEILALDKTFTDEVTGKMDEPALTTLKTALSKKPATDFSLAEGNYGPDATADSEVLAIPGWPEAN